MLQNTLTSVPGISYVRQRVERREGEVDKHEPIPMKIPQTPVATLTAPIQEYSTNSASTCPLAFWGSTSCYLDQQGTMAFNPPRFGARACACVKPFNCLVLQIIRDCKKRGYRYTLNSQHSESYQVHHSEMLARSLHITPRSQKGFQPCQ